MNVTGLQNEIGAEQLFVSLWAQNLKSDTRFYSKNNFNRFEIIEFAQMM
jgi:hypothetical protein